MSFATFAFNVAVTLLCVACETLIHGYVETVESVRDEWRYYREGKL